MRPASIRVLIVVATMALMAFTLPHLGPASAKTPAIQATLAVQPVEPVAQASPTPMALPFSAAAATRAAAPVPTVMPNPVVSTGTLPTLESFIQQVAGGGGSSLAGVYVPGVLALRIVQQPPADINYIDPSPDAATQYQIADLAGTYGLLAHNFSGGAAFAQLSTGEHVYLIRADGSVREYQVETVRSYQAVSPTDPYSNFIDLSSQALMDSSSVFAANFTGSERVVFQTCIEKDGDWSWGRLFVIATPVA